MIRTGPHHCPLTWADHGGAKIEQHGVSRGALAAGIGRGTADPDSSDSALAQLVLDRGRSLDECAVACLADDQVFLRTSSFGHSSAPNAPSFIGADGSSHSLRAVGFRSPRTVGISSETVGWIG